MDSPQDGKKKKRNKKQKYKKDPEREKGKKQRVDLRRSFPGGDPAPVETGPNRGASNVTSYHSGMNDPNPKVMIYDVGDPHKLDSIESARAYYKTLKPGGPAGIGAATATGGDLPIPRQITFTNNTDTKEQKQEAFVKNLIRLEKERTGKQYEIQEVRKDRRDDEEADDNTYVITKTILQELGDRKGYSADEMREIIRESEFEDFVGRSRDDVLGNTEDMEAFEERFQELEDEYKKDMKSLASQGSGQRSGGDWKKKTIKRAVEEIVNEKLKDPETQRLFLGGESTVHHKVSQSRLEKMSNRLKEAEDAGDKDARELARFIRQDLGDAISGGPSSGERNIESVLKNMPGNLEVGPLGSRRINDPGDEFDPNLRDGTGETPRSRYLRDIDAMIQSGEYDWKRMHSLLRRANRPFLKNNRTVRQEMEPKTGQWQNVGGNQFRRDPLPREGAGEDDDISESDDDGNYYQ